jgi:tetratricopeptide (TPR) repeat protein
LGDDSAAVIDCDSAINANPSYWKAFLRKGKSLDRMGKKDDAAIAFHEVLRLNPGNASALKGLKSTAVGRRGSKAELSAVPLIVIDRTLDAETQAAHEAISVFFRSMQQLDGLFMEKINRNRLVCVLL